MNKIADIKDYIWTIPLIGGILLLISFFTPSAYATQMGISEYQWMWGLFHVDIYGYSPETDFFFNEEPIKYMIPIFLSGIFSAIIILITSIMLITSANSIRKGRKNSKEFENMWLGMGILIFIAAIIYMIGIHITTRNYLKWVISQLPSDGYIISDYWDVYEPGFGIIAPFLTGVLAIVGGIISKYVSKRKIIPIKEKVIPIKEKAIPTVEPSITKKLQVFNYCPECGQRITYKQSKYCPSCGFEFPR